MARSRRRSKAVVVAHEAKPRRKSGKSRRSSRKSVRKSARRSSRKSAKPRRR